MRGTWLTYAIGALAILAIIAGGMVVYQYLNSKDPTATLRAQEASRQGTRTTGNTTNAASATRPKATATQQAATTSGTDTTSTGGPAEVLPPGVTNPPKLKNLENGNGLPTDTVGGPNNGSVRNEAGQNFQPDVNIPVPDMKGITARTQTSNNGANLGRVEIQPDRYRFNNLDASATEGEAVAVKDDSKTFNLDTFAPEGESIDAVLATNATTDSAEVPVQASVYFPFYYKGHMLLPIGTRLLGKAAAGEHRDRMKITFTKIILKGPYRDIGKTITINGVGTDLDGTVGIQGYRIGNDLLTTLVPILLQFSNAFTASLIQNSSSQNPYTGQTVQTPLANGQNAAIQAGQSSIASINQLIAQDVEDNKPYVLVLAGTRVKIVLTEPLDTSKKGFGL
jgi:hypothetical protein